MISLQNAIDFFRGFSSCKTLAASGRGPRITVVLSTGVKLTGKVTSVRPVRGRLGSTRLLLKPANGGPSILLDPKVHSFLSLTRH